MSLKNPNDRWGAVSQSFHWLIVLLLLAQGTVGLLMVDMARGPDKIAVYAFHKSVGITILALAVARLLWRLYAGRPAPIPSIPSWQERMASLMHIALYVLLFAVPISGWVMNSATGFPLQWFGLFNLPSIAAHDHDPAARTRLEVAHRLDAIREADEILVMDGGRIVGRGRHDRLQRECGTYRRLLERERT